MVIQMTPHIEQPASSGEIPGAQESLKLKPDKKGIGVFAKILAGLSDRSQLKKTGNGDIAHNAEISETVPLAENAELMDGAVSGKVKGKKIAQTGKIAAAEKNELKKSQKSNESELAASVTELSELEKNVLLAINRLTVQHEELGAEAQGNIAEKQKATVVQSETDTLTASLHSTSLNTEVETLTQPLTAGLFALNAEDSKMNPGSINEKTQNRINPAEINAKTRANTGDKAVENQQAALNRVQSGEKEGKSKLEEARSRKKGVNVDVHDFRNSQTGNMGKDGVPVRVSAETRISGEGSAKELNLELHLPNDKPGSSAATQSWEAKAGQAFEDILARELHQNFNNDIVRHASVILRDNSEGTIRLALKPESLGNVKIRLEMAENRITGKIIVESEEALRAFEREISSLEKAFCDSGFEGANLEMSLAADGRGADQTWQDTEASRFLPGLIAASRYDAAVERIEMPLPYDMYQQARAVNVLV